MKIILILPIILSFFVTLITIPFWIKKTKKIGMVWEDMNKYNHPKNISGSGGLIVVLGFILGVLCYIAIKTFILNTDITITNIFALVTTILIIGIIGFVDDIFGWVHGGLPAKLRIFLVFFAAVPLMVINAGVSEIAVPFLGVINMGILYPLLVIPIGIIGTSVSFNFIGGYNGLEAGQGILILFSLSLIAWLTRHSWVSLMGLCMVAPLFAFLFFNKYPAKVFPGDVLTYSVGALIACMAIFGDFERIAIFIFIPYIMEVLLKLRGGLKKQSFGKPQEDGSLKMLYKKIYGVEHLAIFILNKFKKKVYESDVVFLIYGFQTIIIILAFIIFRNNLF